MDNPAPVTTSPLPPGVLADATVTTTPRAAARWTERTELVSIGVAVALILIWEGLTASHLLKPVILPSPQHVLRDFARSVTVGYGGESLLRHTAISSFRIVTGFIAAVIVGVAVGLWMAVNRVVHAAIDPMLQFLRPIPPLAFIPLLIMWFGIGELPKILLIFFCTLPIMILNTVAGVTGVQQTRVRVAQCLGASSGQTFRYVILPSSLPEIFTGMRVGLGIAWTCLVAAEMVSASQGLGWMVLRAGNNLQSGYVFVAIIAIGIVGYLMDLCLRLIERAAIPWRGKA